MQHKEYIIPSIILSLGFIIGSFIIGLKWVEARANNNKYVTVKGLSEREVVADKAWWSINSQYGANTTEDVQTGLTRVEKQVRGFLKSNGFSEDEINLEGINIYANNYQGAGSRYTADIKISVTTNDIQKVKAASKSVTDLISKGILLNADKWASGPKYYFTKFKELKTDMLAEATKEAQKAAEQFAKNSGSTVGGIRRANQGVFQILPGNRTQEDHVFVSDKIIRVVSTVDYFLE